MLNVSHAVIGRVVAFGLYVEFCDTKLRSTFKQHLTIAKLRTMREAQCAKHIVPLAWLLSTDVLERGFPAVPFQAKSARQFPTGASIKTKRLFSLENISAKRDYYEYD
jgi:hypothetical protein